MADPNSQTEITKGPHKYEGGVYVRAERPTGRYPRAKYLPGPKDEKGKPSVETVIVHSQEEEEALPAGASDFPDLRKAKAEKAEPTHDSPKPEAPAGQPRRGN